MWYYHHNDQQNGPVEEDEIRRLIDEGVIGADSLVWSSGMETWLPLRQTALSSLLGESAAAAPPPPPQSPPLSQPISPSVGYPSPALSTADEQIKKFNTYFMVYWISVIVGIVLKKWFIGFFGHIVGAVFFFMLLYNFWSLIQDGKARTTPGKAVGFLFIPLFNLYWQFVSILGLSQDMNSYVRDRKILAPEINEQLVLAVCILNCIYLIPRLGSYAFFAAVIITIIVMKSMRDSAVAIIRHKHGIG